MPHAGDLWLAIAQDDTRRAIELIEFDPSFVQYRNPNAHGRTPLHRAAECGSPDVVRLLLDRGADINARDELNGVTPLHLAAEHGRVDIVKVLIRHGADVTIQNRKGKTPLFASTDIYNPHRNETQALLLASGASRAMTIFDAVRLGDMTRVIEMVDTDSALVEVRDTGHRDFTLLHHAAETGQVAVAEYLLSRGADPQAEDVWGWTPVSLAEEYSESPEMVALFRSHGN